MPGFSPRSEVPALDMARSWIEWAQGLGLNVRYDVGQQESLADKHVELFGRMIQASAERPTDFARAFAPVLGADELNPFTEAAEGALLCLARNGVGDDLEMFLQ